MSRKTPFPLEARQRQSPRSELYLQSVLPVIDSMLGTYQNKNINPLNVKLEKLAGKKGVIWINLAPLFKDENGQFKKELTEDGLHLNGKAYYLWYSQIRKYFEK